MAHSTHQALGSERLVGPELIGQPADLAHRLGPIMAGARARGVADAFELMGVAAVLIDGTGRVLYAGGRAERALAPLVRVVEDHLVGIDSRANEAIQQVIAMGLDRECASSASGQVSLSDQNGRSRISIRALPFPLAEEATQLLRAILIVSEIPPD